MKFHKFHFLSKRPYPLIFIGIFLFYLIVLYFVSDFGSFLSLLTNYSDTLNWGKLLLSIGLTLAIGLFAALNFCFLIREYALRRSCKKGGVFAGAGALAGLSVGVCPLCAGSLVPLILGLFGVSFSFGVLPFQGVEIQVGILAFMMISTYMFYNKKI